MRRLVFLLVLVASVTVALVDTASADATPAHANCVGVLSSTFPQPGLGTNISQFARTLGGVGQLVGPSASSNDCSAIAPPAGG